MAHQAPTIYAYRDLDELLADADAGTRRTERPDG
jgi:hypothetical protein